MFIWLLVFGALVGHGICQSWQGHRMSRNRFSRWNPSRSSSRSSSRWGGSGGSRRFGGRQSSQFMDPRDSFPRDQFMDGMVGRGGGRPTLGRSFEPMEQLPPRSRSRRPQYNEPPRRVDYPDRDQSGGHGGIRSEPPSPRSRGQHSSSASGSRRSLGRQSALDASPPARPPPPPPAPARPPPPSAPAAQPAGIGKQRDAALGSYLRADAAGLDMPDYMLTNILLGGGGGLGLGGGGGGGLGLDRLMRYNHLDLL